MKDKLALITGASRGIGLEIAKKLASRGANLALVCSGSLEAAQKAAQEIAEQAGVKACAYRCDVSDEAQVKELFARVKEEMGAADIVVNNAGITRDMLAMRMKAEEFERVIAVNLTGAFYVSRAAIPEMLRKRSGRIINITSVVGLMGNIGQANYAASKAGLIGMTKSLARECAMRGVTVNAVAPGFIDTAMTQAMPEKNREAVLSGIPLGKMGAAEDVAAAVAFLASEEAGYITGVVLPVDGGMSM